MKRMAIMAVLGLLAFALPALAEQKLINITEDTIPDDSYRPVAGKEFLVAVKLVDVDVNNQEQPVSNETVLFQTTAGTLSDVEIMTNIYGEAITWLTTSVTADILHSITSSVKDKPEITSMTVKVKNIALPQDAPTAEELAQQVENNASKVQDYKADIYMTSNASWTTPQKQLKIWTKGTKYKVQEISPNPEIVIRPVISPTSISLIKDSVAYNKTKAIYKIQNKETNQVDRYPINNEYIDGSRGIIIKKDSLLKNEGELHIFVSEDTDFINSSDIWIFQKEIQTGYSSLSTVSYTTTYQYSNIQINTGIPDSEFIQ